MDRNQIRQVVTAQFYQSLAENSVQVQSIPQSELQAIVNALADGVFAALAAVQDETRGPMPSAPAGIAGAAVPAATDSEVAFEEKLIWRGRPYLTIGTVYELTSQRLRVIQGLLGNSIQEIELIRVEDTKVKQHVGERMLDIGDVTIISDDATTPQVVLNNVSNPVEVRELVRKAVLEEKQRRGIRYRVELE
jgi:hypothetical protein